MTGGYIIRFTLAMVRWMYLLGVGERERERILVLGDRE